MFENIVDNGGCNHQDAIQGVNATGVVVVGNLFINDEDGFADFDVATSDTATDNACYKITRSACITLYADLNSVVEHNTAGPGVPGALELGIKPGQRKCKGTVFQDNVGGVTGSDYTLGTDTHTSARARARPISRQSNVQGGSAPSSWAGYELTSTSAGHQAATDGSDVGIRVSAGGPPTS